MRESRCKASGCILSRERCIMYSVYSCVVVCIVYSESELAQKLLRWSHEKCPKCAEVPWCKPSPPPPASCEVTKYKYGVREKQQKYLRQDSVDFLQKCKSWNLTAVWCQYQFWPKVRAVLILLYDQSLEDPFQQKPLSLQTRQVQQKIKSSQILVF